MYYLAYDYKAKKFVQKSSSAKIVKKGKNTDKESENSIHIENSTHINFPQKSFWNDETNEIYTVFRQG